MCTNENPCMMPALRWVHSDVCKKHCQLYEAEKYKTLAKEQFGYAVDFELQRDAARAEIVELTKQRDAWARQCNLASEAQADMANSVSKAEASAAALREALDLAWGLIANANGGDWTLATPEWKAAAERWRDNYAKADADAGAALLERLRRAEEDAGKLRTAWCTENRLASSLLLAAQSLHQAWRNAQDKGERLCCEMGPILLEHKGRISELERERDALVQRLSDEHLCGHGAQSCDACTDSWSAERRMLVAVIERMKAEVRPIELAALHAKEDAVLASEEAARLLASCQSLHRAWKREFIAARVYHDLNRNQAQMIADVEAERDALRAEVEAVNALLDGDAHQQVSDEKLTLFDRVKTLQQNRNDWAIEHGLAGRTVLAAEVERLRGAMHLMPHICCSHHHLPCAACEAQKILDGCSALAEKGDGQ